MSRFSRTDRSAMAEWWRTIDQPTLFCILGIAIFGVFVSVATGSASEARGVGMAAQYFVRHAVFTGAAIAVLLFLSMRSVREIRTLATILYIGALGALALTLLIGPEINGATRWLRFGPLSMQPSEFLKPGFVVLVAWTLSQGNRVPGFPGYSLALFILLTPLFLLLLQPDIGQSVLITAVWGALLFAAGLPLVWTIGLAVAAGVALGAAYVVFPHVTDRINTYLMGSESGLTQVDFALRAMRNGGLFGTGPGEGTVKAFVPDAHTDFAFAVMGEELGLWTCIAVAVIFLVIVARGILRSMGERDHFVQLAAAGLFLLVGMQAFINMGVNVGLLPAKGMTLPFISYGGSSLIATGITLGFALALTRRRAGARRTRGLGHVGAH